MKKINLAVVGATGMVGRTFLKVLEERQLPIELLCYGICPFRRLHVEIQWQGLCCGRAE